MTGNDKKLYKDMNTYGKSPTDLEALSPSESQMQQMHGVSPNSMFLPSIERLSSTEDNDSSKVSVMKRKMLFTLISTLNASFPDYDFSSVKSEAFSREESLSWVVNNINSNLSTSMGEDYIKLSPRLWKSIDDEICLQDCQIFRYHCNLKINFQIGICRLYFAFMVNVLQDWTYFDSFDFFFQLQSRYGI